MNHLHLLLGLALSSVALPAMAHGSPATSPVGVVPAQIPSQGGGFARQSSCAAAGTATSSASPAAILTAAVSRR